jgi:phasin
MNDQFTRQAQDMFAAAKDARIPENVQAMAEDGVAKSREAFAKMSALTKENTKAVEDVMVAVHAGAKSFGEKVMRNTEVNTEAVFDAAQAIARAKTFPEALRLQTSFMQQQFQVAGAQAKELFELSTKLGQQTFETVSHASSKAFEQAKSN